VAAQRGSYSDDQLLEIFVSAADGAARARLEPALRLIEA
jgi:hypothetical protein